MIRLIVVAGCLAALTGCATVPAAECAGRKPLRPKAATVDYLAVNDPELVDALLINNLDGEARCGWKR